MNPAQARINTYWLIAISLTVLYLGISDSDWSGSKELHTVMETISTVLALFIGIMSLVRFYSNGMTKFLILGAGAIGVASLDACHVVLTSNWLEAYRTSELDALIPWSWLASRLLLAFIFLSIIVSSRKKLEKVSPVLISKKFIYFITACAVSISILIFIFIQLPAGYYDNNLFNRPVDLIPGFIFLFALLASIKPPMWNSGEIEHWLIISLILSVFTQLLYMPLSQNLFDVQFDSAHLLKILSYTSILCGLIFSSYHEFIKLGTEVDVRKYSQRALEASEARNRTLMNSLVDGLITINNKGIIENINSSACLLFGYSKLELLGKNIKILMPQPYHSEHDGYLKNYEMTGKAKIIGIGRKVIGLKKSGKTFPIDLSVSEMMINGVKKYSGIIRDDTDRNKAEEDIINARNKAETAAQAKSDFLATMSHEIRTPMNGVVGMVEILENTPLNNEQKDIVNTISESGHALVNLINDILEISKIESGKIEFNLSEFNLEKTAYDVAKLLSAKAHKKNIDLILYYHANCPKVVIGDKGRIRQILLNLVGNAVKFTLQGHVLIDISCTHSTNNLKDIKVQIIDTGIGINEDKKHKLFESFTQADSSTSRKYGGTGLGLSISRKLINIINGELDVISSPDKGSTFWFNLKLETHDNKLEDKQLLDKKLEGITGASFISNSLHRETLQEHLRELNVSIDNQGSFDDFIKSASNSDDIESHFKFIILDNSCNQESTENFIHTLRSEKNTKNIPIILYNTNHNAYDNESIERLKSLVNCEITTPLLSNNIHIQVCYALNCSKESALDFNIPEDLNTDEEKQRKLSLLKMKIIKSKLNILLVEDVIVNQKVALGILSDLNLNIDIANNGQEAVDMFKPNKYDIILMDCQMPVMDGYEATNTIRKTDSQVPIIAITANALSTDKKKCIDAGMNDYISKPYNKMQLLESLSHWATSAHAYETLNHDESKIDMNTKTPNAIDANKLEEMKNIMGDMFTELIPAYIEQSDSYISKMPSALANHEFENLERYAHSMKSSSLNVGAQTLSNLSRDLEELSRANQENDLLDKSIKLVTNEYTRVKQALIDFNKSDK